MAIYRSWPLPFREWRDCLCCRRFNGAQECRYGHCLSLYSPLSQLNKTSVRVDANHVAVECRVVGHRSRIVVVRHQQRGSPYPLYVTLAALDEAFTETLAALKGDQSWIVPLQIEYELNCVRLLDDETTKLKQPFSHRSRTNRGLFIDGGTVVQLNVHAYVHRIGATIIDRWLGPACIYTRRRNPFGIMIVWR